MYVEGLKRSSKYTVKAVHNAMYVEGVERDSKYSIRAHNVFAHNFLNIQLVFNPKKVLESWDLGLFIHIIHYFRHL